MMSSKKNGQYSIHLADFLNFVTATIVDFSRHERECKVQEDLTQDILHELELGPADNKNKLATKLKNARKERRVHKDYCEIHEALVLFFESQEGKILRNRLTEILGGMRKQEQHKQNRYYVPRIKQEQ